MLAQSNTDGIDKQKECSHWFGKWQWWKATKKNSGAGDTVPLQQNTKKNTVTGWLTVTTGAKTYILFWISEMKSQFENKIKI